MEKAVNWDGYVKIKTIDDRKFVFKKITIDVDGIYKGDLGGFGKTPSVVLNLDSINEIWLEDKEKTEIKDLLIKIPLSVAILSLGLLILTTSMTDTISL